MNDEWWWMMMTMISIRILIRFDDYPASGGNKLRMLRANKLMCLCSRRQHSWLTGPKGPSTVSRDRPLAFAFTGMSRDLDVWVVWSSVGWTRYILLVWFDQLLEVWIPFLPICSCQTPLASTISTPWLCSCYVFHVSCSLYWCNMLTQFDTIPCGCSLAVDD